MYTALPDTFTQVKVALPFEFRNRSPSRPPQPEVAPSGSDDCHTDCWSLCENSFGGSGTLRALYSARVVGWIKVPTLSSTPSLPASKIVLSARQFRRERHLACVGQRDAGRQCGRGEAVAGACDAAANVQVGGVVGGVVRDHRVGVVVAAVQEHADERLVVARRLRRRFAHCGEVERPGRGDAGHRHGARAAQEFAPGELLGVGKRASRAPTFAPGTRAST